MYSTNPETRIMANSNNLLKAAVRKHAAANGHNPTDVSGWGNDRINAYAEEFGVTPQDNLKSVSELRIGGSEEAVEKAVTAEKVAEKASSDGISVEAAIRALIDQTAPKAQPIDEKAVVALIEKHARKTVTHTVQVQRGEETVSTRKMAHKAYATVLATIAAGVNLAAVGPAGSGKSTIFEHAAEDLGLDYYFQGAVQQEHKILGYMDGNGTYHRTQFRDAYENGGLFVFEEFDGSGARALLAINNAVAGSWCDFPDGKVRKHENFVCVMAGNTFGTGASRQYVGRQQLDAATLDRFSFLEIGYDEDLERAMAQDLFDQADAWVNRVQSFRRAVEKQGIRHVVSPRATIMGCKLLKAGMDEAQVIAMTLHKGLSADQLAALSH
jgi:MoxR-like ATPase